eukprot:368226-Rhodomonas_salina.1
MTLEGCLAPSCLVVMMMQSGRHVLGSVQVRAFHHAVSERVHRCVAQFAPRVPRPPVVTGYN